MHSNELKAKIAAPPLTEDDSFNSNIGQGILAYRLPALDHLFGIDDDVIKTYSTLSFVLSVEVNGKMLDCIASWKCTVMYVRNSTPVLYYINPPVVYKGALVEFWYDPKTAYHGVGTLDSD